MATVPSIWSELLHAMWRAERHGHPKRASIRIGELYTRLWPHQRVQESRQRDHTVESIRVLRNISCVAREGTCPTGTEHCKRRFGGGLQNTTLVFQPAGPVVPDPTEPPHAPRTQESNPSTLNGLGAHYDRFQLHCPLGASPL